MAYRQLFGCIAVAVSSAVSSLTFAQTTTGEAASFQPTVGQSGKDVVWVPTPQALVDQMLNMANLTKNDVLVDLGSGDGRTVITAAQRGANARGIEYNPDMVAISEAAARKAGVTSRAKFIQGDIFETDFSDANVVTLFLLPTLNERLRPTIIQMKPGTRIVSNSFSMADWEPDEKVDVTEDCTGYCTALLWIVPAQVDGTWNSPLGTLTLKQHFQNFEGDANLNGVVTPITEGKLRGDRIEFKVGSQKFAGKVDGKNMAGVINGSTNWSAIRP